MAEPYSSRVLSNREFWFTPHLKYQKISKRIPNNIYYLKNGIHYADHLFDPDIRNGFLKTIKKQKNIYDNIINSWIDEATSKATNNKFYTLDFDFLNIKNTVDINSILDIFTQQAQLFDPHNILNLTCLTRHIKEKFIFDQLFKKTADHFILIDNMKCIDYLRFFLRNSKKVLYIQCLYYDKWNNILECLTQFSKPEHVYIILTTTRNRKDEYIMDYYQFLVGKKLSNQKNIKYFNTLIQPILNNNGVSVFEIIKTKTSMIPNEREIVKHIIDKDGLPDNYNVNYLNQLLKEEKEELNLDLEHTIF